MCEGTFPIFPFPHPHPMPQNATVCAGDGDICTDAHSLPTFNQHANITITTSISDCDDCDDCDHLCSDHDHRGEVPSVCGVVQTIFGNVAASSGCLQLLIGDEK